MADMLVKSKVKEYIKNQGMNTGSDALEALDNEVEALVKKAVQRAKDSGQKTVMARHV